jgi:hypothetical protein
MNTIAAIFWVAASLFVLFETTAVYEYFRILPLPEKITKIKEYEKEKNNDFGLSYKLFWLTTYDCFFIRLITCPYCLAAWLSLIFSLFLSCLMWVPLVYFGGLTTYFGVSSLFRWLENLENSNG